MHTVRFIRRTVLVEVFEFHHIRLKFVYTFTLVWSIEKSTLWCVLASQMYDNLVDRELAKKPRQHHRKHRSGRWHNSSHLRGVSCERCWRTWRIRVPQSGRGPTAWKRYSRRLHVESSTLSRVRDRNT